MNKPMIVHVRPRPIMERIPQTRLTMDRASVWLWIRGEKLARMAKFVKCEQ